MKLTRREFLKDTAVASAVAGVGLQRGGKVLHALTASAAPLPQSEKKLVTVFCPGSGCHANCPLQVHVVDGRIAKVQAAPFLEQPEDTHCCLKGLASAYLPYYPNRLKYPMKRAGVRGEGKWEQITWDEALDTIAQKLIEARDKYGAQSILCDFAGSSQAPTAGSNINAGLAAQRFGNLFGWTNPNGWVDDTGSVVADFFTTGNDLGGSDTKDMMSSNLIVVWGANPAESGFRDMKHINLARAKGVPLVVIGPLFDPTAAKADWWIPIRRATDAALGMAMIQVIIAEGLHNEEFLRQHTVAPLLVQEDNGLLLRESDIQTGGSEERFVVWDEARSEAMFVDRGQQDVPDTLALTGTFTVEGVACRPAFQKLIELVNEQYTPEQAAEVTGVPAETIRELARRYASAKPAAIYYNFGLGRYFHGNLSNRAQLALAAICGYLGQSGGGVHRGAGSGGRNVSFNTGPIQKPTDSSYTSPSLFEVMQTLETGEPYPIKVWIHQYRNPIQNAPNPQRWIENVLPNIDFIVDINIHMDWTAQYADMVLPDATIFERISLATVQDHVVLSGPAIEPLYESHPATWIWSELAKRVGLGDYFQMSDEDYVRIVLDSDDPALEGITLEKLRQAGGMLRFKNIPSTPYVQNADMYFDTPTGRIEFYAERLLPYEEELPVYKPSLEAPSSPDLKYPLQYYSNRKKFWMHTFMGDIPALHKFMPEPWLEINPEDAQARGIKDGDLVEVLNSRGRMIIKAAISSVVPPGSVRAIHGPGPEEFQEGHYQMLTLPHAAKSTFNPVHDLRYQLTRPWWKWAGGQADIIFDCAVEVQRV
jgi:anaerobic selenocysteine-containing dehydrogenase